MNINSYISDLEKLIKIPSLKASATDGAPFGTAVRSALDCFLDIAKNLGFQTKNYQGYMGEVTFGDGEEIGIIGHVDVVPAGPDWSYDPFSLTLKDGILYGRGVSDDKGPLLISLYALKGLKDSGIKVNKKFRLLVGCDEESGWKDIEYFNKHYTMPEYGFSPDGNFPLSYAEKGMTELTFHLKPLKNFVSLKGGTVVNAVCAHATATCTGKLDKNLIEKYNLIESKPNVIESHGKSAHGSQPQLGINALDKFFRFFYESGEDVKSVIDCLFDDVFEIKKMQNEQGYVTFSPDLLASDENGVHITCDLRIPAPYTLQDVLKKVDEFGINYSYKVRHDPVVVNKNGWFVNALSTAYSSVSGLDGTPVSMGGSTFARAFNKGCAFGTEFPGFSNNIHEPNERLSVEHAKLIYEIYLQAYKNLCEKI